MWNSGESWAFNSLIDALQMTTIGILPPTSNFLMSSFEQFVFFHFMELKLHYKRSELLNIAKSTHAWRDTGSIIISGLPGHFLWRDGHVN